MNGSLARYWPIIALAFPLLELIGIISIWGEIGAWTLLWLLLAALAGAALISVERIAFMPALAATMMAGGNPLDAIKASGLRFLAGLLLIVPGAISDAFALLLLLWSLAWPRPPRMPRGPGEAANDDVIEGDCHRID